MSSFSRIVINCLTVYYVLAIMVDHARTEVKGIHATVRCETFFSDWHACCTYPLWCRLRAAYQRNIQDHERVKRLGMNAFFMWDTPVDSIMRGTQ